MKNEKKNLKKKNIIEKKKFSKNFNSFLYPNSKIFDLNDKEKEKIEEFYINIDSSSNFTKQEKNDIEKLNKIADSFKVIKHNFYRDEQGNIIKDIVKYILAQFLIKLYPKCPINLINIGNISLLISKEFYTKHNFSNQSEFKIEENINYFFNKRYEYKYAKALKFSKIFFENFGKILIYIYSEIKLNNITELGGLKYCRNIIIDEKLNVLTDFYNFCISEGYDPTEVEKTFVWKCLENKYSIPAELTFLINIFQEINTIDIDIEFACDILNEEDFSLFAITILNITYIFPKLENMKLNLINSFLQYFLYEKKNKYILNLLNLGNETFKKNRINKEAWIYGNKWDFEQDFNIEIYNKRIDNEKRAGKKGKIKYGKYSNLYIIESNNYIKNKDIIIKKRHNSLKINNINDIKKILVNENDNISDEVSNYSNKNSEFNSSKDLIIKNIDENLNNDILKTQIFLIYNTILFIVCSFTNLKKLELISNDFYSDELLFYLKENLKLSIPSEYTKFHFLNLLYTQIENIDLLNVEINSLDSIAFKKILNILSKNKTLNYFKISLFSCNASYLIVGLFKIYEKIFSKNPLEKYILNLGYKISYEKLEEKIVNDLSSYFAENLSLLFKIIKSKNDLKIIGFNFDLPNILINNKNYLIPIFKFIINILLLIDNNEANKKSNIEKLIILSKNTIFDSRNQKNINNLFKNFLLFKYSKKLKEFHIQCQFYNIIHIKNIISIHLIKLSIGDLDLETFSHLVDFITSYEFSSKSSLQLLKIKLINKITEFNLKIKQILQKIFYIKIKTLLELGIFSNIIIKDKFNYLYLINLLKYNWIPSYVITLNKTLSKPEIFEHTEKIPFLIFPAIEKNTSGVFQIAKNNGINVGILKNECSKDDELFWILKYIFYCKYPEDKLTFLQVKNLIFNIAKFIYPISDAKLSHDIC